MFEAGHPCIQAVLTLDSQDAKRQYFLASKCGFDYFVRDSKGLVFGETERKNGFTIKHENMPERLVKALIERCDFLDVVSRDTKDLALYLQKHYKAIYLSDACRIAWKVLTFFRHANLSVT